MLQPRREQNFAIEPLGIYAGCKLRVQNLDDHGALERDVVSEKHSRHASAAQFADDRVLRAKRGVELIEEVGFQKSLGAETCGSNRQQADAANMEMCAWWGDSREHTNANGTSQFVRAGWRNNTGSKPYPSRIVVDCQST